MEEIGMKLRSCIAALMLLFAVLLVACDQGGIPTVPPAPAQNTATTQELQATIAAMQTVVASSEGVEAPTPVLTAEGEATSEAIVEATTEPTTEATIEATAEAVGEPEATTEAGVGVDEPTAEPLPTDEPVVLPEGPKVNLAGHPRLLVTAEDLPRLQSWAVDSNPIYANGLKPVLELAKTDMDAGTIVAQDNAGTRYTDYPNEMFAELFAFGSLISTDQAEKDDYAKRARTLLMRIMNEAAKGYADGEPYRDMAFPTSDRSRWQGEAYGLTVDWIYPYLSAEDKTIIRKVFLMWSNTIVTQGYRHPEPIGMVNDPQLLSDKLLYRWAANNYFGGNMRNMGFMALSFDSADDPGGELAKYLNNAIGARLYMADYVMRNDAAGGLPAEGFEYGGSQLGYILQFLYALHTAKQDDTAVWGPQVSIDNPFWKKFTSGYLHSFSPAPLQHPEYGLVYQPAFYGDGEKYLPPPDFMEAFGPLQLYDRSIGNTAQADALRWIETNMAPGGPDNLMYRANDSYNFLTSIMYFMMYDPKAAAPEDPHKTEALNFFTPGTGHILSRTGWDTGATWFNYSLGWTDIDHQQADGNNFDFYRKGEWLTKERVGYELFTSDYHNTVTIQNDKPDRYVKEEYLGLEYDRGSQLILVSNGGKLLAHSFGQGFTYGLGESTGLYNSDYEAITDVTHASRSVVWLKSDYVVVYDRATTKTEGRYKRFWLQTPTLAKVEGNRATMTTEKGQQLFDTALLPKNAEVAAEEPDQWGVDNTAVDEPMKFRIRVEAPGGPKDVRFLNVLQGADAGAKAADVSLVESTGGNKYEGSVVNGVAVMFPVDLGGSFSGVEYTAPSGTAAHIITGLTPNAGYDVDVSNDGGGVKVSVKAGSKYKADDGGVLVVGTVSR